MSLFVLMPFVLSKKVNIVFLAHFPLFATLIPLKFA